MINPTKNQQVKGRLSLVAIAAVFCAACSSVPPPTDQIAVARSNVESALASGAIEFAPVEIKAAQDKLTEARIAMERDENSKARRLAEQVQVDAKLAELKTRANKAQAAVQETRQGIQTLQNELNRKSINTAP